MVQETALINPDTDSDGRGRAGVAGPVLPDLRSPRAFLRLAGGRGGAPSGSGGGTYCMRDQ